MKVKRIFCEPEGVGFIRRMLGLTQNDLAKVTGLTKMTISNYENKRVNSQGPTSLLIGLIMYDLLFKSNINPKLKNDVYELYFHEEEIEL